ncbi:MAG: hypothetical protein JXR73_22125 [Candidatus Omnitrophica bacterium]|nr:hypothetical protein [Candidatus Omnitrophota bacterium]
MKRSTLAAYFAAAFFMMGAVGAYADEAYFFWKGSAPDSVSWASFDWEGQGRSSGFATSVQAGEFYNHTPDAGDDVELNQSITFSLNVEGNRGAHHPTVLPGGIGVVSLWVYYDFDFGMGLSGAANSVYLSVLPGPALPSDNYLGIEMIFDVENTRLVSSENPSGIDGPAMIHNDWNHLVFTDDGNSVTLQINDEDAGLSLSSGGNLWYINIVDGVVTSEGSIENGECQETWYIDDIECSSSIASGVEYIDAPLTSNTVAIDGVINPDEVAGANQLSYDGSSTERPGVHAQFYGQWQLPTPEDLTATVYLQNDGVKLYISVDVLDDVITLKDGASWWEEDSTEIYIDHDQSRSTSGADQISVRADNQAGNQGDYSDWLAIQSQLKPENDGWQIEAGIDMAALNLSQGESYGFDISINDSDGENEPGYQGAQEWLYACYETAYYNETYWGNVRILSEQTPIIEWEIY